MFEYIKGTVAEIILDKIILEVNGIAYRIHSTMNSTAQAKVGEELKVYTYLAVKEDEISLYGFVSKAELDLFKMLISVSKIGPKVATGMLSTYTPEKLVSQIRRNDINGLSKIPGVGKKTAERVVLELKDKVKDYPMDLSNELTNGFLTESVMSNQQEVLEALMALGYHRIEAEEAVLKAGSLHGTTEEIIKRALKLLVK